MINWPDLWMMPLNLWNYPSQTIEPFETEEDYLAFLDKLEREKDGN